MDEIEQRLKDTTEHCVKSYEAWRGDKKSDEARENLLEAIHELRKVASRLEIELAVSEREQLADRPIAIPPHRSSRKAYPVQDFEGDDDIGNTHPDDNIGNGGESRPRSGGGGGANNRRPMNRGRRPAGKSSAGGGGGNAE